MSEEIKDTGTPKITDSQIPRMRTLGGDARLWNEKSKATYSSSQPKKSIAKLVLKILLILLAIIIMASAARYGYFYLLNNKSPENIQPKNFELLIRPDEENKIIAVGQTRTILLADIEKIFKLPQREKSFRALSIYLIKENIQVPMSAPEFFSLMAFSVPEKLKNKTDLFTLGTVKLYGISHPFLILRINSFTEAYEGTKEWERDMQTNLRPIFDSIPVTGGEIPVFSDKIIKNQDARILTTDEGTILAYSFFNKNLVIITDAEEALAEIINRYEIYHPK